MSNEDLLPYFCTAAKHPFCSDWTEHRLQLDHQDRYIHHLIDTIPDSVAVGKSVQRAAEEGQTSLIDETPKMLRQVVDIRDITLPPQHVYWTQIQDMESNGWSWLTRDQNIKKKELYAVEDSRRFRDSCRAVTIETYKPREVFIYFNGEPDEWNGKR